MPCHAGNCQELSPQSQYKGESLSSRGLNGTSHPEGNRDKNSIQVPDSHSYLQSSLSWATSRKSQLSAYPFLVPENRCTQKHILNCENLDLFLFDSPTWVLRLVVLISNLVIKRASSSLSESILKFG